MCENSIGEKKFYQIHGGIDTMLGVTNDCIDYELQDYIGIIIVENEYNIGGTTKYVLRFDDYFRPHGEKVFTENELPALGIVDTYDEAVDLLKRYLKKIRFSANTQMNQLKGKKQNINKLLKDIRERERNKNYE